MRETRPLDTAAMGFESNRSKASMAEEETRRRRLLRRVLDGGSRLLLLLTNPLSERERFFNDYFIYFPSFFLKVNWAKIQKECRN